jgi:signal transduction histidine kinase
MVILLIVNRYRRLVRRRNHELREMNDVKDKFFSVISHDLKNPVLAQKNALAAIVDNYGALTSDDIYQVCIELLDSSKSLIDLLYNLLNWSRLQTGRITFTSITFPLIDVVRDVQELSAMQLAGKSLTLLINVPLDATVTADRNMIDTLLRNLVGNAIKFSYSGGTIEINARKNGQAWTVSVTDHGTGMSPAVQASLFSLATQKSAPGTCGETGSGLGLVVCREIMELHGGAISVQSVEKKGSTFSFTLQE